MAEEKKQLRITGGDITDLIDKDKVEFLGHFEIIPHIYSDGGRRRIYGYSLNGERQALRLDVKDSDLPFVVTSRVLSTLSAALKHNEMFLAKSCFNYCSSNHLELDDKVIGFGDLYSKRHSEGKR